MVGKIIGFISMEIRARDQGLEQKSTQIQKSKSRAFLNHRPCLTGKSFDLEREIWIESEKVWTGIPGARSPNDLLTALASKNARQIEGPPGARGFQSNVTN